MNLELYTWIAIVVLVAGSIGIFVWFIVDARRLYRRLGAGGDAEPASTDIKID